MSDYVEHLDRILAANGNQVLEGGGTVSHKQAMDKARQEYQKFRNDNLSPVEQEYLQTIKSIAAKTGKKSRTTS